jgi:hypothetical protein
MLDEGPVACANIPPGAMRLRPLGHGTRGKAGEAGVPFKTDAALIECALSRLAAPHSGASSADWTAGWAQ